MESNADSQTVFLRIREAVASVVVGNEEALDWLLIAVLCRGHALLEDVPGVGKTLLARSLAAALGSTFRRIQFTPDVLPSDVTGSTSSIRGPRSSSSGQGRCSRRFSSRTRSTAPRPVRSPPCWKPCRSAR